MHDLNNRHCQYSEMWLLLWQLNQNFIGAKDEISCTEDHVSHNFKPWDGF